MLKRIRDLDLESIVDRVLRATDVARERACAPLFQEALDASPRLDQRIESLRNYIGLGAMDFVETPAELRIEQPMVEAFVRIHHHPSAPPQLADILLPGKDAAGPRLQEIAAGHPELKWDKQIVKALLWRAIQTHPDHELDDAAPPWKMHWGPSYGAAHALIVFITYEALGSLENTDPSAETEQRQLEQQTIELARQMRDAIDRYDDPDVAAQREAYERAKAERIGAQLASFYVKTGQRDGNEPLDQAVAKMLRYFAHRIDSELSDAGESATIDQPLPTLDSGALVWLDLVSAAGSHELLLHIKSPDGKTTKSMIVERGTKLPLVTFLEAPTTPRRLIEAIDELDQARSGEYQPFRIRHLNVELVTLEIMRATDPDGRHVCVPKLEEMLEVNPSVEQRLALLRNNIGIAALKDVASADELQIDQPLVEAFIRMHSHPAMPPAIDVYVFGKGQGGARFDQLATQHPDLVWDKRVVRDLLWQRIQANGDHVIDGLAPPWRMSWGPAAPAAQALIVFATLDAMRVLDASKRA